MNDLSTKKCKPCEGGVDPLPPTQAQKLLQQLDSRWELAEDSRSIRGTYEFANFHETMAFVNAVAWVAIKEDHHPDLNVGYSRVGIVYTTHAISGLSENDFICAAKIDRLDG